ncbi:uncharacterized protein LOC113305569 [Papaver somniferum]|uniref:uncharacterized protein LOC113305569 n=1 Tax=Papaver somniferum TaxID=3469 RepID=UPI000E702377|nr:uncharacterized protein LOC113305569 [Papaver somniferum]
MYNYSNYNKKKEQWAFIHRISRANNNPWIVLGDLNFHFLDNDSVASSSSNGLVNGIIKDCGLDDIGYIGKNYTWTNNNIGTCTKKSRINMAIGNDNWSFYFPNAKLMHFPLVGSDHSPIMLVTDATVSKCWKPFKFFLTWLNDDNCATFIANSWKTSVQGSPAFQFNQRLHITRRNLTLWNKEHFGDINQRVDKLQ